MYGFIYMTINNINGKRYIGKKKYGRDDDKYLGSGKLLKQAINKYGRENFSRYILCEAKDHNELNTLEKYYINKFNAQERKDFYNISSGGDWGDITKGMTKEEYNKWRLKISENNKWRGKKRIEHSNNMKGEKNHFYNKKHTDETKKKISQSLKGKFIGENNHFYGKKHSEETKEKIRKKAIGRKLTEETKKKIKRIGKDNGKSKSVIINFNDGKILEFESLTQTMSSLSVSQYLLWKMINNNENVLNKYNIKNIIVKGE